MIWSLFIHEERPRVSFCFVELRSKGCNSMLKSRTVTVAALAGKFGHSSGPFGHRRGFIRSVESFKVFGAVT